MKSPKSSGKPKKHRFYIRRVVGSSMSPTLMHGRLVLFISMQPRVDDIVMLRHDGREKIKRIVQLRASRAYVVGDNELASTDSRHFGWLPAEVIIAKLVWPRKR